MALQTVHVLATTPDGTRAALAAGRSLARRRHAHVVLLITARGEWETARSVRVARQFDQSMPIRICQGRDATDAVKQAVPALALVVIGGPARRWWPTAEQRLAERLCRHGRDAVFVPEKPPRGARQSHGSICRLEDTRIRARHAPRISAGSTSETAPDS